MSIKYTSIYSRSNTLNIIWWCHFVKVFGLVSGDISKIFDVSNEMVVGGSKKLTSSDSFNIRCDIEIGRTDVCYSEYGEIPNP